jgi:protein O-GlcNAc transferase
MKNGVEPLISSRGSVMFLYSYFILNTNPMTTVNSENLRERYDKLIKLYTKTQDKLVKTGKSDNEKFLDCIKMSGEITAHIDTLHPIQCISFTDIVSKVYCMRADLLVRTVGLNTSRPNGLPENEKNVYHTSINLLRRALAVDPFNETAMELFKVIFIYLTIFNGNTDEIILFLKQVLVVYPHDYQLQFNLGFAYQRKNDLENALVHYKLSNGIIDLHLQVHKTDNKVLKEFKVKCLNSIGSIYYSVQDRHVAKYYFQKGLLVLPNDPDLHNQMGVVYTELRETEKAIHHYREAIKHADKMHISTDKDMLLASLYMNMGLCICYTCDFQAAIDAYNKALSYKPRLSLAYQNKLLDLNYISHLIKDPMYVSKMHKNINKIFEKVISDYKESLPDYIVKTDILNSPNKEAIARRNGNKITIGFVSGDFICHPVSYFISSILKNINYDIFNVVCYTCKLISASATYTSCKWVVVRGMSSEELSNTIKADKVDILFDLSGHTGDNRLDTFVMKPAPIQISYCGYPGTSGVKSMDYRLTDAICDGKESEKYYQEKLVYLDKCFLNYTPSILPENIPLAEQPYTRNGYITFGCFNRFNKINSDVIDTWEHILGMISDARLVIKTKEFTTESLVTKFKNTFKDKSILERVTILKYSDTYNEHLPDYNLMDISLDTFPYSGTTTSCESLMMGVPVLTFYDNVKHVHSQNVTTSLLINSNLKEYVTYSKAEYIEKALQLAKDGVKSDTKQTTRDSFMKGNVCNYSEFIDSFENTLINIYKNHNW